MTIKILIGLTYTDVTDLVIIMVESVFMPNKTFIRVAESILSYLILSVNG